MKKFLNEAANKIIDEGLTGPGSVIILPNRRSEVFLKEEIKKKVGSNIWLPSFYPVDEFMQTASGLKKADNISIFFELYNIHRKVAGNEAKTIDEFLTWAPIMLSDFNDLDNSMADAGDVFKQLSAIKAIQQWNPDGRPLTELQNNYLHFFNSMFSYYSELGSLLISENTGYQGLISRQLAENTSVLLKKHQWHNFLIVGINALSEAELRVFNYINQNYNTSFLWDVDHYYFSKNTDNNKQEAGKYIHHVIDRLKIDDPDNIGDNLNSSAKNINILGVPKNVGQTKFMGQELQKLFDSDNKSYNHDSLSPLINTAIVLADESLLMPLLNSLPVPKSNNENTVKYNVTLGYPLNNSQVEHFFNSWIDLIISISQNNGRLFSTYLIPLINNPVFKQLLRIKDVSSQTLVNYLIKNNITKITFEQLKKQYPAKDSFTLTLLAKLVIHDKNNDTIRILENLRDVLLMLITEDTSIDILIKEQTKQLIKILGKLLWLISLNKNIINYKAIKKIGRQLISQSNINLIGEPLRGIQIMGMLETRTLDFENIYILSTNEGIIPKSNNPDSFIPMDIRHEYNLPLPSDKASIYAYHFYRLIQRAKNVNLIYNSDAGKFGGGEKSRFILQVENELQKINPNIKISNKIINTNTSEIADSKTDNELISVNKNEQIQQKLNEIAKNGYSPSVLNSYITCSLKFYLSHVLKISTTNSIEQSVEANTFGTVVHGVLEEIYKPIEGKEILPEILKEQLPNIRQLLKKQFQEHYNNGDLGSGKNLLIFEVANNYITNFIKWEINNIKQKPVILQGTEIKLTTSLTIDKSHIIFKGIIDRIDKDITGKEIRIIDYKTGRVQFKDLKVKTPEELASDPIYSKAFQVLYYAWLVNNNQPADKLETGIISLRNMSSGFIPLILEDIDDINEYFQEFSESIKKLVMEISDINTPFIQTGETKRCTWCDYKSICNR